MPYLRILGSLLFLWCFSCSPDKEDSMMNLPQESKDPSGDSEEGRHFFEDGSLYEGDLIRGKPDGYGTRVHVNSDVYEGQFRKGMEHGYGTIRYKSDETLDRYVGTWNSGKMDGFGALVLTDASRMEGNWRRGRLDYGDYQGSDGEIKRGKWRGNSLSESYLSEGFSRSSLGDEFYGFFETNGAFLKGHLLRANGDLYVGSFRLGKFEGDGILERTDGTLYVGEFEKGEFSGTGILTDSDGSTYSGEFLDGLPDGYGVQQDANGVQYTGSWQAGLRSGPGLIDFGDGSSYRGEFRLGLAYEGIYDWGDGRMTNSYQNENGEWSDR